MLHRLPDPTPHAATVLPASTRWTLWGVTTVDVMVVVWMIVAGQWLDSASLLTSVITLGGHHELVLGLALVGFTLLAGLAPLTRGFAVASRFQLAVIPVAGVVSVVALAGLLSVFGLSAVVLVVLLAVLLGGRPRARITCATAPADQGGRASTAAKANEFGIAPSPARVGFDMTAAATEFDPHALLAGSRLGVLATIKADGRPQLSPVTPGTTATPGSSTSR